MQPLNSFLIVIMFCVMFACPELEAAESKTQAESEGENIANQILKEAKSVEEDLRRVSELIGNERFNQAEKLLFEMIDKGISDPKLAIGKLETILEFYDQNNKNKEFRLLAPKLALVGSAYASRLIGFAFLEGTNGVELNVSKAMLWFGLASEQNDSNSKVWIGRIYETRNEFHGGRANKFGALYWYVSTATQAGDSDDIQYSNDRITSILEGVGHKCELNKCFDELLTYQWITVPEKRVFVSNKTLFLNTNVVKDINGNLSYPPGIFENDYNEIKKVLETEYVERFVVTSTGGDAYFAYSIGELLHTIGIPTIIAREVCKSACAHLMLYFDERLAEPGTQVSFHQSGFDKETVQSFYNFWKKDNEDKSFMEFGAFFHTYTQTIVYERLQKFVEKGVDAKFAIKTLSEEYESFWTPSWKELLNSNFLTGGMIAKERV